MQRDTSYVLGRIEALRSINLGYMQDRWRIRNIMNGGADGIKAIMAWDQGKGSSGRQSELQLSDLPAVNMMASGVERLAQQVGVPPGIKMPYGPRDSVPAKEAAEVRERVVGGWDHLSRMPMQYPQIGRWLPGYGFFSWVVRPKVDRVTGQLWPHAELRDSFDVWPGFFGATQQPHELAIRRQVPYAALEHVYPGVDWASIARRKQSRGPVDLRMFTERVSPVPDAVTSWRSGWEGAKDGAQVIEYFDDTGTYLMVPEFELMLEYTPNICDTGPMFVAGKRFSFDRLISQYHHATGLVAMMAKLNILGLIAAEDSTFRETNIIGDMEGNVYERGRFATNYFERGTTIERPTGDNNAQLFAQIDRLEGQLRIAASYPEVNDSIPQRGGWVTGRGTNELRQPVDANVSEYQNVIADALEQLDTRRLEWEEKHEKSKRKRVFWIEGDRFSEETYVPKKDIGGNWRSQRIYGMMAGWDDSSKIIAGLQLLQARVIDVDTFRDNLRGIQDPVRINERLNRDRAKDDLFAALEGLAGQGDGRALLVLAEIQQRPDQTVQILQKFFTAKGQQPSPEEQQMMSGQTSGAPPEMGTPPTVQTVLSELAASGKTRGGAQTVTVNRR